MARVRLPLLGITAIAIASGALLPGSSALASPCPFGASNCSNEIGNLEIGNLRTPNGLDKPQGSSNLSDSDRISGSGESFRRSDGFTGGREAGLASHAQWLNVTNAEVAGFGTIVGLFAIAILYKIRRVRKLAPGEVDLWSKYPFLEHPEMVLTRVPQEALSSVFETEAIATRW